MELIELSKYIKAHPEDYSAYIAMADLLRETPPFNESLAIAYEWMAHNEKHPVEDQDGAFYWLADSFAPLLAEGDEERALLTPDSFATLPDHLFESMAGPVEIDYFTPAAIPCITFLRAVSLLAHALANTDGVQNN